MARPFPWAARAGSSHQLQASTVTRLPRQRDEQPTFSGYGWQYNGAVHNVRFNRKGCDATSSARIDKGQKFSDDDTFD